MMITGRARLGVVLIAAPSSLSVTPLTIVRMDPGPAPPASSPAATRTMKANRRRDTLPELRVRRALHGLGLRFLVDVPVPGTSRRRSADVLLRGARIALYVDGCFWHSCPEHQHLPRANREWWQRKLDSIVERDIHTDAAVHAVGWWHCGSGSTKIP
ncbi:MAG TPA: very short patch repair endonuclease [Nocardioidaceae bacterium]|nr:very short patch repair endonuclease [Nocardioidaceae bacterium]